MLNIKDNEKSLVGILFLHSFLIGISITFLISGVSSLFLSNYSAKNLPYVYTAIAIILPLVGLIYNRVQNSFKIESIFKYIVISILSIILILHMFLLFGGFNWVYFALMIVLEISIVYFELEFWGVVGILFDIRQSKRLMGIVGSGQELAAVIGGFSVPFIIKLIGTENLIFIVELSILGVLFILITILKKYKSKFEQGEEEEEIEENSFKEDFRDRYITLIFTLTILASFAYYFVDYIFFEEITLKYPNEEELAGFIGIFFAVAGVINFFLTSMVSGLYLSRFGILISLLSLPILIGLGATSIVLAWLFAGTLLAIIPIAILTKIFYISGDASIDKPSTKMLYQVFHPAKKLDIQSKVESFIDPIAGGVIGVVLILLTSYLHFDVVDLSIVLLFLVAIWIVIVIYLKKEYTNYLLKALSKRKIGANIEFDSKSLEIVKRGLNSKYPAEILYSFSVLEKFDKDSFFESIKVFTKNFLEKDEKIQEYLLEQIQINRIDLKDRLVELIKIDENVKRKGKLIKTFASVAEEESIDFLKEYLNSNEKILQKYSVVGLIRSSGISGVLVAGERFNSFANSESFKDRVIACEILAEVAIHNFYQPLIKLLQDENIEVKKSALFAASKIKHEKLWEYIIDNLHIKELTTHCSNTLVKGGDEAFQYIEKEFYKRDISINSLIRIIKICGKMKSEKAKNLLINNLDYLDEDIYFEIVSSLSSIKYQAVEKEKLLIKEKIKSEIENSIWIAQSIIDLKKLDESKNVLLNALEYQIVKNRNRLLNLLSLIYSKDAISKAKFNLEQKKDATKIAYAFELLDNVIEKDIKDDLFTILENTALDYKVAKLKPKFPQKNLNITNRLIELSKHDTKISNWVKCTLIYTIGEKRIKSASGYVKKALLFPNSMLKETAIWTLHQLNENMDRAVYEKLQRDSNKNVLHTLNLFKGQQNVINTRESNDTKECIDICNNTRGASSRNYTLSRRCKRKKR